MAIVHNTETGQIQELVVTTQNMQIQPIEDQTGDQVVVPLHTKKGLYKDTYVIVDEIDGMILVKNFPVTRINFIDLKFRSPSAADDAFISKILSSSDDDPISGDWKLLNKFCIQWNDESKSTLAYYMDQSMPYSSLLYLRRKVLPLFFPSFDD